MKGFEEYRNFYSPSDEVGEAEHKYIYPAPKTFKEWAQAKLSGLDFDLPANLEPKTFAEYVLAVQADPEAYAFPTADIMLAESISGYAIDHESVIIPGATIKVFSEDGETPANILEIIPDYKYGQLFGSIEEESVLLNITTDGHVQLPNSASGEINITSVFARVSKLLPKTPTEIYTLAGSSVYRSLFPQYVMKTTETISVPTNPGTLEPGPGGIQA